MKKLPIGISSLEKLRKENCYYVDKTHFVEKLVNKGNQFFLSRPRRFGKSLLLDTLKQAFLGNKQLFEGTYLENNWNWEKKYPVIHLDLSKTVNDNVENFKGSLDCILQDIGQDYSIALEKPYPNLKFEELIKKLYKKYNLEVVVLVDEYDKPILDNIENIEKALEIREVLREFYSILKASDQYLKLVFITGVSRFSKISIFSGLNQLNDITLDTEFATICGYTQSELETVFKDRLEGVNLEKLKYWYNGYNWLGEKVYNPFDVLLFFDKKDFRPYWFETGTPTFLMKLILNNKVFLPKLEEIKANDEILANLDVDFLKIENLFFQTGYLTIRETKKLGLRTIYILTYPNFEVKSSFNNFFLSDILPSVSDKEDAQNSIVEAIEENDLEKIKTALHNFFASIPNDWYRKNDLDSYEGFYASVVYALFTGSGLDTKAEDTTNIGKIDLTVFYQDRAYIIEFKVVEKDSEGKALNQIKEKKYYEKYTSNCREIYLVGIEFSKEKRNIVYFEYEKLNTT